MGPSRRAAGREAPRWQGHLFRCREGTFQVPRRVGSRGRCGARVCWGGRAAGARSWSDGRMEGRTGPGDAVPAVSIRGPQRSQTVPTLCWLSPSCEGLSGPSCGSWEGFVHPQPPHPAVHLPVRRVTPSAGFSCKCLDLHGINERVTRQGQV